MTTTALIVEDNADLASLIAMHVKDINVDGKICADGKEALGLLLSKPDEFDVVILDIMLPSLDGNAICQQVRAANIYTPIIMLTSRDAELDRVLGLEIGADDYLTKPFSVRELQARVKAQLRRAQTFGHKPATGHNDTIILGDLSLDISKREIKLSGQALELTATEFDLLSYLAKNPGQVFSRSQLLDAVWGYTHSGYEHTVNSHINRLRNKIESNAAEPKYIQTVWGVGYRMADLQVTHA